MSNAKFLGTEMSDAELFMIDTISNNAIFGCYELTPSPHLPISLSPHLPISPSPKIAKL